MPPPHNTGPAHAGSPARQNDRSGASQATVLGTRLPSISGSACVLRTRACHSASRCRWASP